MLSEHGVILSLDNEILLRPHLSRGYPEVVLYGSDRKRSRQFVHTLVALTFLGPRPACKSEVNHKNGIRHDNWVGNLEYVTPSENKMHSTRVLGRGTGENHGRAKLTYKAVAQIRKSYSRGQTTYRQLAAKFSVSDATIKNVVLRKYWV